MKLNTGTLYIYIYIYIHLLSFIYIYIYLHILYTYIYIYICIYIYTLYWDFLGQAPVSFLFQRPLIRGSSPLRQTILLVGQEVFPDQIWPPLTSAMDHLVQWFTHDFQSKFPFPYCESAKYSISVLDYPWFSASSNTKKTSHHPIISPFVPH